MANIKMTENSSNGEVKIARLAISELFLDTEINEDDLIRISDTLNRSKLPIDILDKIYYDEIAPLLYKNLNSIAGEWTGFDSEWLEQEISKHRKNNFIKNIRWVNNLKISWVTRTTISEWNKIKQMLESRSC